MQNTVLQRIKNAVKQQRISQKELAEKINKTEQTVNNYFSERTKIDIDTLQDIARSLNLPVSYFFTGEQNQSVDYEKRIEELEMELKYQKEETEKMAMYFFDTIDEYVEILTPKTSKNMTFEESKDAIYSARFTHPRIRYVFEKEYIKNPKYIGYYKRFLEKLNNHKIENDKKKPTD